MQKALLIEDNEQNRYLIQFLLSRQGFEVDLAEDGEQGLQRAAQASYDVILLDIQLPVMDGYSVARQLRKQPRAQAVPIVAVTSYAMVGDRERALASGCDGYIEKPIDPDTFVESVRQVMAAKAVVGSV